MTTLRTRLSIVRSWLRWLCFRRGFNASKILAKERMSQAWRVAQGVCSGQREGSDR